MYFINFNNSCDGIYSSLDVRFTKKCDNDCSFCIEKTGIDSLGTPNVINMVNATFKSGIKDVLILGGEPFLYPKRLFDYVSRIRHFVDKIYITTSIPATLDIKEEYCKGILDLIDGLNVSIQHIDPIVNNQILKSKSKINRIKVLKDINSKYANKVRTSINLVKGFIDNSIDLYNTIFELELIGCRHIKINELQHSPDLYVSFDRFSTMNPRSPFAHGCQTDISESINNWIWGEGSNRIKVTLKRSCFLVEKSQKATFADVIKICARIFKKLPNNKFRVLYENGTLQNNWLKKC